MAPQVDRAKVHRERHCTAPEECYHLDQRYGKIGDTSGWEDCAQVLISHEKVAALRRGWRE